MDPIEASRIARERAERTERDAVKKHGGYELPTDRPSRAFPPPIIDATDPDHVPPPPSTPSKNWSWRPRVIMGQVTVQQILAVIGSGIAAAVWLQGRASKSDVDEARAFAVAACSSAITAAIGPMPMRMDTLEKRAARNDSRWDRLDDWNFKVLAKRNAPPPPKFGPKAEQRGEVKYEEEVE